MNLKERFEYHVTTAGVKHWIFSARKDEEFIRVVEEMTPTLTDIPLSERIYTAVHDGRDCPNGSHYKFESITKGWKFCGRAGTCACANAVISHKAKHNVDHAARLAKTHATLKERYGEKVAPVTSAAARLYQMSDQAPIDRQRAKETMMDRYGVSNPWQLELDRKAIAQRNLDDNTKAILNTPERFIKFAAGKSVRRISEELGIHETTVNNYINRYECRSSYSSSFEDEIAHFLTENNLSFRARDRTIIKPKELDFYIDDHRLGIEFNGLYWHSSEVITDDTHRVKYEMANHAGIRLLMINEDEWIARPEVLKKKILNLCGKSKRGVGARKLLVREIERRLAMDFCERHHIQGSPSAVIFAYGAFQEDRLVGVITFGRQRGTGILDLTRFCSDGATYAGLFSKMMKFVSKIHIEKIVTFADLRYSDGGLYECCGFTREALIPPDYRYVKRSQTFHKSLFTKKRIEERFGVDMSGKTERQAMTELGYSRIYDCGKIRFVFNLVEPLAPLFLA